MRIYPAMSPVDTMTELEVDQFLRENKGPLKLGTVDQYGDPVIHPLWYYYDTGRFYLITASDSKKMQNVKRKGRVYFCIDTETRPYKGVKGKGTITTITDMAEAVDMGERIITKYMGNIQNPLGNFLMSRLKIRKETVLEIHPHYFSVWDDSKSP